MPGVEFRNRGEIMAEVKRIAHHREWSDFQAFRVARMVLMCAAVESWFKNYANANVEGSLALPHDAVGYDHDSVGICQQRVGYDGSGSGGWGTLEHCQSVHGAVDSFVGRLADKGLLDARGPLAMGRAVQSVQVSAYPTRYQAMWFYAGTVLRRRWKYVKMAPPRPR